MTSLKGKKSNNQTVILQISHVAIHLNVKQKVSHEAIHSNVKQKGVLFSSIFQRKMKDKCSFYGMVQTYKENVVPS